VERTRDLPKTECLASLDAHQFHTLGLVYEESDVFPEREAFLFEEAEGLVVLAR
jgi:hypothetical protein